MRSSWFIWLILFSFLGLMLSGQESMNYHNSWVSNPRLEQFQWEIVMPEAQISGNTEFAYGHNDGTLWQGRGINGLLQLGGWLGGPHWRVLVSPQVWFAQNLEFDLVPADVFFSSEYGYFLNRIDLPQRLGDQTVFDWYWGESDLRFFWEEFSIGVGTTSAWVGPGYRNAIIYSNNAPGIPRLDLGFTPIVTDLGDFEFRAWFGFLESTEYWVTAPDLQFDYLSGVSISYRFPFLRELTFGLHRTSQTPMDVLDLGSALDIYLPGTLLNITENGKDQTDGRMSVTAALDYPEYGSSIYAEWARDDYSPNLRFLLSTPDHSAGWTLGYHQLLGEEQQWDLRAEITNLTFSLDYFIDLGRGLGYYRHKDIIGYSNHGQVAGAAVGPGGSSQYIHIKYQWLEHNLGLKIERREIDNEYIYKLSQSDPTQQDLFRRFNVQFIPGLTYRFDQEDWFIDAQIDMVNNINRNFIQDNDAINWYFSLRFGGN